MNNPVTHNDIIALKESIDKLQSVMGSINSSLNQIDLSVGKPIIELAESIDNLGGAIKELAESVE